MESNHNACATFGGFLSLVPEPSAIHPPNDGTGPDRSLVRSRSLRLVLNCITSAGRATSSGMCTFGLI